MGIRKGIFSDSECFVENRMRTAILLQVMAMWTCVLPTLSFKKHEPSIIKSWHYFKYSQLFKKFTHVLFLTLSTGSFHLTLGSETLGKIPRKITNILVGTGRVVCNKTVVAVAK